MKTPTGRRKIVTSTPWPVKGMTVGTVKGALRPSEMRFADVTRGSLS